MTEIKINKKKNLCYIKLSGYMEDAEILDARDRAIRALDALSPNLTIINDISAFRPVRQELLMHIAEVQKHAFMIGVDKVIRIVENPLGKMQFTKTQSDSGSLYRTIEVATYAEAIKMMEQN